MQHPIELLLLGGLAAYVLWSFFSVRKSVRQQSKAVATQDEGMKKMDESLALARKSVENQEKIIALLESIVKKDL